MMKKYMMTVAASLMLAGNLFAIEEIIVSVDHQHTHGVQEHKHTHEIIVKNNNGPTLEEMINQAKYTIAPGFHTGILEGVAQGVVAISKEKLEAWKTIGADNLENPYKFLVQNDIYLMPSIADTADFVTYFIGDVLRNDPEQCTQRPEGEFTPYLGEKIVHNMFKFAVALATIEAVGFCNDQKLGYDANANVDIKKQKAILIESYINTLFRGRNIVGEPYVKMFWNTLLRGITEGVTVVTHQGNKCVMFNAQGAAAAVASVIVSEMVVKYSFGKKMQPKKAKRLERLFSNVLTAYFKNMFTVVAGNNSFNIENQTSSLLAVHTFGAVAGVTLLGWGIQHQYVQAVVRFFANCAELFVHASNIKR